MYKKHYYLYIAPIKGEENSVERQLKSGKDFKVNHISANYKETVIEDESEMDKPVTERKGFNSFHFDDTADRQILVMDIGVLNNMGYDDTAELKSCVDSTEITVISNGRFVANFGCDYPSPISKCISKKAYNYNNERYFRSFKNVAAYCCRTYGFEHYKIGPFTLAKYYATMVTGTHNLVIYDEPYADGNSVINDRKYFKPLLEDIMVGRYDLVIIFKRDFRTDEFDIAVSVIRKYVPVILIDNDDKFTFLDMKKEEYIYA